MLTVAGVQIFAQGFVFVLAAVGIGTPEGSPAEFVGQAEEQLDSGLSVARLQ
jgi:hypothetical protein